MPRGEPALSPSVNSPENEPYLLSKRPLTQGTAFCQPFVRAKIFLYFSRFYCVFLGLLLFFLVSFSYFCARKAPTIVQSILPSISRFNFRFAELSGNRTIKKFNISEFCAIPATGGIHTRDAIRPSGHHIVAQDG